jgi:hypothetical protein
MRGVITIAAVTLALGTPALTAQTRPDFSGTWIPAESTSVRTCSGSIVLTQDAATLRLESTTKTGQAQVYSFDGSDTRRTLPAATPPDPSQRGWVAKMTESVARAAWNGDRLVTVRHDTMKMWWPGNGPGEFNLQNTFRETMSLDAGGRLVIDHLAIQDPYPGGSPVRVDLPLPDSWNCIYTKQRADLPPEG